MAEDRTAFHSPVADFTVPIAHDVPSLADPGQRFIARLIDNAVGIGLFLVFLVPGFLIADGTEKGSPARTMTLIASVLLAVLSPLVYEIVLTALWGATFGKRAMNLRVVRVSDARRAGWTASTFRALINAVFTAIPCVGYLDPLWCLWDKPNRQTLHDKSVRTIVIRVDNPPYREPASLDGPAVVDWRRP
ncbi:RDD family protein [Phytomonospora sp. NPDC050363]|uniref:RDD family protein n=1 Tax=Phytomonospora sp. NPDC050363 TaxID=3155642 RepID=UPI0033D1B15F